MAEQNAELAQQHTAEDKTQSTNPVYASPPDECKQANNNLSLKQTADLDSSSASTNSEDKNNSGKNMEQTVDKNDGQEYGLRPEGMDIPKNATSPQTVLPKESEEKNLDEQRNNVETTDNTSKETTGPTVSVNHNIAEEDHTGEMKAPETTTHDNQVDGPKPEDTDTEAGGDSVSSSVSTNTKAENDNSENMEQAGDNSEKKENYMEQKEHVEIIGPTSQEDTEPAVPEVTGILEGRKGYLIAVAIVAVFAILVQYLLQHETPPHVDDVRQIDIFLRQLKKVKTQFPNQRVELWNRSRIHLQRHLQTAQPTEPVSLILTAGIRAERTLHCLAQGLASAFSSALNASVLHIDGASKASQDSDKVKLDIDKKLQGAFGGDKPVAVIHRFEELPPGSTLIFYRYCDHENAAFKKTFLIFTVLLGEEEAIPAKIRLSDVEEMVDDHLKKKFLSHGQPVSFDRMDLDKYGGLWSRISHLILPVASEERVERDGCKET